MNSIYTLIDTSKLITLYVDTRHDLDILKQRGAFKAKIDADQEKLQIIKDELKKRNDYRECFQGLGNWTFPSTIKFASFEVLCDLFYYHKTNVFAIDNGILLFFNSGLKSLDLETTKVITTVSHPIENKLIDPTEQQLLQSGLEFYDEDIQTYLRSKAKNGADGSFQNKVGLKRIDFPVERVSQTLAIHVVPVSYWVIREFNRRILNNPDPTILELREKSCAAILAETNHISITAPSALYVEVTLVTRDQQIVIVEKNKQLSALAGRGLSWTCTLEEGFVWTKDFQDGHLNLKDALARCLLQELKITSDHVVNMEFYGVALEYTHLNTAIVGKVVLDLLAKDLSEKVETSEDYGLRYKFVSLESAYEELFLDSNTIDGQWHPLARMRILLTLINEGILHYVEKGGKPTIEETKRDEIFISYSHKDGLWRDEVQKFLKPHFRNNNITVWDDTHIKPGQLWDTEIKAALQRAKVAILLVSSDFLASDYVHKDELPDIFKASQNDGLTIIWIAVRPSAYKTTSLKNIQCAHQNPDVALSKRPEAEREDIFVEIADYVASLMKL